MRTTMKKLSFILHAVVLLVATLQYLILIHWREFWCALGSCHPHDFETPFNYYVELAIPWVLAFFAIGIPVLGWILWGKAKEFSWIRLKLT